MKKVLTNSIANIYHKCVLINKDKNVHRFAFKSALRGKLLERERERERDRERERERERDRERETATNDS